MKNEKISSKLNSFFMFTFVRFFAGWYFYTQNTKAVRM